MSPQILRPLDKPIPDHLSQNTAGAGKKPGFYFHLKMFLFKRNVLSPF